MTLLTDANHQLFTRPPEEHFESFEAVRNDAEAQKRRCTTLEAKDIHVQFQADGETLLFGNDRLRLTHFALAQMATMARVPMPILARLDAETRTQVLNQTFPRNRRYRTALVDDGALRCVTSDRYERVWDAEVLAEIDRWLLPMGFVPARPTINSDQYGTNILGSTKPALFRSDRDSFFFFYGDKDPGDDGFGGLRKGVMVFNSEVGAKSFGFSTFYFREMCANFLIWDATGIRTRRARHTGAVQDVVREFREQVREIGTTLTTAEYDAFDRARRTRFVPEGPNEQDDAIRRLRVDFKVPEEDAREIVDLVRAPENPGEFTVWGVVNGITSAAKGRPYAADRAGVERLAAQFLHHVGR